MRFLLLGGTGQVGCEFLSLDLPKDIEVIAPRRSELDITDTAAIARTVAADSWNAVINAAAYTNVDRAESEQTTAFAINAKAPAMLARETARRGIPLIHISTDYVFDGRKQAPYVETDATAPLNVYGQSKLAGEQEVALANPRHVILRTSWVYSPYGQNFVRTILRLAGEREQLTIVDDQRGCPTAARDVAKACQRIALACASQPEHAPYGIYHYSGAGETTWFGFAKSIVEMASTHLKRAPHIVSITTAEYRTAAARPLDTRLDCRAITRSFAVAPRPWRESLAETLDQLLPAGHLS
jgi:dTDP-4-dehydrorhamnose reductase